MAVEKDSFGLALDIFDPSGELRREAFEKWREPDDYAPPFMAGLTNVHLRESQMIFHDMGIFPGGKAVPSATGTRFMIGDRILDLVYANQTDMEESLGVDLVYYNSKFESYAVVQYKRMYSEVLGDKNVFAFRPSQGRIVRQRTLEDAAVLRAGWIRTARRSSWHLQVDGAWVLFQILSSDFQAGLYCAVARYVHSVGFVEELTRAEGHPGAPRGGTADLQQRAKVPQQHRLRPTGTRRLGRHPYRGYQSSYRDYPGVVRSKKGRDPGGRKGEGCLEGLDPGFARLPGLQCLISLTPARIRPASPGFA